MRGRQPPPSTYISLNGGDSPKKSSSLTSSISSISSTSASTTPLQDMNQLQATITALTSALQEMNLELREKSLECDALQETVTTLSQALRESEEQLQQSALHCEQLDLKLQAVTFIDRKQMNNNKKPPLKRAKRETRKGLKRVKERTIIKARNSGSMEDDDDEEDEEREGDDDENEGERNVANNNSTPNNPDANDAAIVKPFSIHRQPPQLSELIESSAASAITSSTPLNPNTPGQAAFYRVIYERDQARREADRLQHEVLHRREQVRKLKAKLNKSNALIELSYEGDCDTNNEAHVSPMKWLMKGQKVKSAKVAAQEMKLTSLRPPQNNKLRRSFDEEPSEAEVTTGNHHQPKPVPHRLIEL